MDFLAKVCSEKQVNNVNNDSDGTRFPKSKEEKNVMGTPQMNEPAVQGRYSAASCLNGSISMSNQDVPSRIVVDAHLSEHAGGLGREMVMREEDIKAVEDFQRAEVRDQDVPISMSSEQQYGAIMQTTREIRKSQPVVTHFNMQGRTIDFGTFKRVIKYVSCCHPCQYVSSLSYRASGMCTRLAQPNKRWKWHIGWVSRYHPCEYVFTLSSGGGRCTRHTEGNKRYCSLHDDVFYKEESSTKRPAKCKKEESSTERPAKRKKEEQHNCILCWEATDNLSSDQILKQQQRRLLLLRHASVCTYPAGECTVTPDCESMKSLWDHVMNCKSENCSTPHCVSSRYLLSHYRNCKEETCPVCGPYKTFVRKTIAKYRS